MKSSNHRLTKTSFVGLTAGSAILSAMVSSVLVATPPALAQGASTQCQGAAHATQSSMTASAQSATIAAIASSSDSFETLTAALEAAGLVDILNGTDEYTVFAPTDEAFAALPEGTLEALLQPENRDQLVQILTYHVVPGRVLSTDLSEGAVTSAEGSPLSVSLSDTGVSINEASVIQADVEASNGVIHVIDQVLLPPTQ